MSCCGGKKTLKAVGNIATGSVELFLDTFLRMPSEKHSNTDSRTRICQQCETATWMTKTEIYAWITETGIGKILKNIGDLTVFPDLQSIKYKPGAKLLCQKCKCFIPAKARVKDEKCPLGKW